MTLAASTCPHCSQPIDSPHSSFCPHCGVQIPAAPARQAASAAVALDYQTPSQPNRRWQAGTLSYTTAGLALVIFWLLLGYAGVSYRDRGFTNSANLLLKHLDATSTVVASLNVSMPQAIAMIFSPIIGYWSDRYRSRWGRRIPFLFLAAPITMLALVGVAFCPQLGRALHAAMGSYSPGETASPLIVFGVFWACFHFGLVCGNIGLTGLVNDVLPRSILGRFMSAFRMISLIAGITFNYLILGHVEAHFQAIFISFALVSGIPLVLMCLMVREGNYPPPEQMAADHRAGGFFAAVGVYCRECFSKPYYLWVFAAMALAGLMSGPVNWFSIFFAKSLNMDMATYGKIMAANHLTGFLLAYPIGVLADRFHPLRVSMATVAAYAITLLLGSILIRDPFTFGCAMFAHMVISGTYLSASGALAQMLLPRLKFAQYWSAALVLSSLSIIVSSPIVGIILDKTGKNYRLTYVIGFALAAITLAVMSVVHRKFMALGGPRHYVAPE
ncbi:MFS transporter [Fontivita pretiosa]|uniref:MFS transporter n=1 Tax=Fontivita pretiosa TaxID=2989684 RepID=UPI003D166932